MSFIDDATFLRKSIEVNNYNEGHEAKSLGYVILLLVTTLGKFQFFVAISAHSTTYINQVCLGSL